jgi:hypothetical protein
MDYVWFVLFMVVLAGILFFISWSDKKMKRKYVEDAVNLIQSPNPERKKLVDTIRGLRLYGGRWRKDPEFQELRLQLQDKLASLKE